MCRSSTAPYRVLLSHYRMSNKQIFLFELSCLLEGCYFAMYFLSHVNSYSMHVHCAARSFGFKNNLTILVMNHTNPLSDEERERDPILGQSNFSKFSTHTTVYLITCVFVNMPSELLNAEAQPPQSPLARYFDDHYLRLSVRRAYFSWHFFLVCVGNFD